MIERSLEEQRQKGDERAKDQKATMVIKISRNKKDGEVGRWGE